MEALKRWAWYSVVAVGWPLLIFFVLDHLGRLIPGTSEGVVVLVAGVASFLLAAGFVYVAARIGAPRGVAGALSIGAAAFAGFLLMIAWPAGGKTPTDLVYWSLLRIVILAFIAPVAGAWVALRFAPRDGAPGSPSDGRPRPVVETDLESV